MPSYLGDEPAFKPSYRYKCPRQGCRYETVAYTETGMRSLADQHRMQHNREDQDREYKFRTIETKTPEEYEKLRLTWLDMCFLVTRGIKVDEDIELDPSNPKAVQGRNYPWLRSSI